MSKKKRTHGKMVGKLVCPECHRNKGKFGGIKNWRVMVSPNGKRQWCIVCGWHS